MIKLSKAFDDGLPLRMFLKNWGNFTRKALREFRKNAPSKMFRILKKKVETAVAPKVPSSCIENGVLVGQIRMCHQIQWEAFMQSSSHFKLQNTFSFQASGIISSLMKLQGVSETYNSEGKQQIKIL